MNYSNNATNAVAAGMRVLVVVEALVFAIATLLHLGVPLPVGFAEPVIIPAAIVEGLITLFLAVSAYALFTDQTWAWPTTTFAHAFAVAGILFGITALALGAGPNSAPNYVYHRVMLVVAAAALILLLLPIGRAAIRRQSGPDISSIGRSH
jgi:hypothetical protein